MDTEKSNSEKDSPADIGKVQRRSALNVGVVPFQ